MSGMPVLLFLDVSGGELLVIMLVVFLVFGPEKMPDIARKVGRVMNQMKKASSDLTREFKKETSAFQQEIDKTSDIVSKRIENVSREINSTKTQIANDLNTENQPDTASAPPSATVDPSSENPLHPNPPAAAETKPEKPQ